MGTRLSSPCSIRNCPNRSAGHGLCIAHEQQRRAQVDAERPNSRERGYDAAWRALRAQVLREEPTCRLCPAVSVDVHHIVPIARGGERLDRSNLMSLCRACHSRVTMRLENQRRHGYVVSLHHGSCEERRTTERPS